MEIWVKNNFGSLVPMYGTDYDNKRKLKIGQEYLVIITLPRNIKFHRKMFALYNLVFENRSHDSPYSNVDDLRRDVTIAAGYCRERVNINGEITLEADSISFASMQEDKFAELYNATLDVIVKYFNFDKQSMIDEIEQYF